MSIRPIEILIRAKDEFSGMLGGMQAKVAAVAVAIAGFFGISLFSGAVKSAAEFEAAMSRVKAATGASAEELGRLKQAAEDAGANTKYTSVQAAEALENLAKAGLSATQAIEALPAVLALAQAGDIELGTSAEFVTKAVMGMGLAFADAGRVADVLALGANATNTSVKGLAEALSYAAPTAQSLGLSLETTVAIIGKFADAGIDASRAGTALNSIMSQFSDPASKFRNELAAIGITTGDFNKALHELAASGTRGSKAINAVGLEAGPALKALLNQGMAALDELKAKLDNAAGSAAATAETMSGNLNGSLNGLASAWDTIKTVLGTPVLPVLKDGVDQLAGALRELVNNGTITKFGESFAEAFRAGIKWARDFFDQIDFKVVVADMQAFAAQAGDTFRSIGEHAAMAGNAAQTAYGVMSAGTNVVLGVVYGLGEAFAVVASKIQSGLALIYDGFAKVTFGEVSEAYKLAADEIRLSAEATMAAAEELGRKSSAAFIAVADGAQTARNGFAGLAQSATDAKPAIDSVAAAQAAATKELEAGAAAAAAADVAMQKKASADQAAKLAAEEHRAALAKLREEYAALIARGDVQGAAEKLQEINKALKETPAAAKASADAIAAVESAFRGLGVTSSADLKTLAETARTQYEAIKNAGTSTAQDIGNAFAAYATKAIAANGGVADSTVKAEAAMRGYKIEVDAAGQHSVKLATSVNGAAKAMQMLGIDAGVVSSKMSSGFKDSAAAVDALSNNFGEMAKQGVNATESITLGLNKLMSEAKNQADIDALTAKIQSLRGVLGDKITDGFLEQAKEAGKKLKETMDAATPGINSVAEAMKTLGIKSEEELDGIAAKANEAFDVIKQSGTASPREISEAWKAMAEASIAANDGVADAAITSGAAAQGFAIEVDKAGKASVKALGEVKEGFEKVDYAAQMAGKSVEELQAIKAQGWNVAEDMQEAADIQNAATNALTNAWRQSIAQADEYYSTLSKIYSKHADFQSLGPWAQEKIIWDASKALKELDAQQQAVERSSDDAATGLASLEDKLLALSGSEEEVAAQRKARDQAEIQKKMALLELDLQRAQIRKNDEEAAQLAAELKLYRQQLVLIDQIAQKEKSIRDAAKQKKDDEDKARQAKDEEDAKARKAREDKAAQDQKVAQQKTAQGDGSGGGGSASITAAPVTAPASARIPATTQVPVPAYAPVPAQQQPGQQGTSMGINSAFTINIHLAAGVDLSDRAQVDRLARTLVPALESLSRRGA